MNFTTKPTAPDDEKTVGKDPFVNMCVISHQSMGDLGDFVATCFTVDIPWPMAPYEMLKSCGHEE